MTGPRPTDYSIDMLSHVKTKQQNCKNFDEFPIIANKSSTQNAYRRLDGYLN